MATANQVADPAISRTKFNREIRQFRTLAAEYRQRGWYLADASFPTAVVVLAAHQVKPSPLVLGVRFDYSDYDLRPPSVQLVDPFTAEPYTRGSLPTQLPRRNAEGVLEVVGLPEGFPVPQFIQSQPLMQAYDDNDIPFLCIAGVREYHDHPGHSGDSWELHRSAGAGRLIRLLEIIDRYGTAPMVGYRMEVDVKIVGYQQNEIPE